MNTLLVVVAVSIIVVAVLMLLSNLLSRLFRPKAARLSAPAKRRTTDSSRQWRAVRIAPGLICCGPAKKLNGRVFLAGEAPKLPLDDCTETDCRCRYLHLQDRRSGEDRRMDLGEFGTFMPAGRSERRTGAARRTSDPVI